MSKLLAGNKMKHFKLQGTTYLSMFRVPFYVFFINCEVLIKVSNSVKLHSGVIKDPLHNVVAKVWITLFIELKIDSL